MKHRLTGFCIALVTSVLFVMPAHSMTTPITGGITKVEVTAADAIASLGLELGILPGTELLDTDPLTVGFPITGGELDKETGAVKFGHSGGVTLSSGNTSLDVSDFYLKFDGMSGKLFNTSGNGVSLQLFDISESLALLISEDFATVLTFLFNAPNLTGVEFGVASPHIETGEVPLPAAAWLFLSALCGLTAIGRNRKTR